MRRSLCILVAILAAGCAAQEQPTSSAALRRVKPTTSRAAIKAQQSEAFARADAIRGLVGKGPEVVPQLIQGLGPDQHRLVREAAIETLGRFGAQAREAAPAIAGLLEDDGHRSAAMKALTQIGPDAVPVLASSLEHKNPAVRASAAEVLAGIGPPARPAAPALRKLLADPDQEVRLRAIQALGRLGDDPGSREALETTLQESNPEIQFAAAEALSRLDPQSQAAVRILVEALKNPNGSVRGRAINALRKLGPVARSAAEPLVEILRSDPEPQLRAAAARALARVNPEAAVQPLIAALKDPEIPVRNSAADALGEIGPAAREAIPALTEAMKALNSRESAYQALQRIRGSSESSSQTNRP